jgi:uncharacterized Zn finger protein
MEKDARSEDTGAIESPTIRVRAAALPCENCGRTTPHRVLRWDRGGPGARSRLSGIARCQECRWTHPFVQVAPGQVEVALIVSEGARSSRRRVPLPAGRRLQVGSGLPGGGGELEIRRIDTRDGESVASATTNEAATVWAARTGESAVPVSIVGGARTVATRWVVSPETEVGVGDGVEVDGVEIVIVGLRARGHTWKRTGDRFVAREVQRVYGRRRARPPAGRRDWSRERLSPNSEASSASTWSRSRSGPGTRRARTVPRAATAVAGAAVQSDSPP